MAFTLEQERAIAIASARKRQAQAQTGNPLPEAGVPSEEEKNTFASGLLETISGFNRAIAGAVDFLGPDQVNNILELSGSDQRVPTVSGAVAEPLGAFNDSAVGQTLGRAGEAAALGFGAQGGLKLAARGLPTSLGGSSASVLKRAAELRNSVLAGQGEINLGSTGTRVLKQAADLGAPTAAVIGAESSIGGDIGAEVGGAIGGSTGEGIGRLAGGIGLPVGINALSFPFVSTTKGFNFINKLPKLQQQEITSDLANNPDDLTLASFLVNGSGNAQKNALGLRALKQDVDPTVVKIASVGNDADRTAVKEMAKIMKSSLDDGIFRDANSPFDVVGKSIAQVFKSVKNINTGVGKQVEAQAGALKGKINITSAKNDFFKSLGKKRIKIEVASNGPKLNFKDSQFKEGSPPAKLAEDLFDEVANAPDLMDALKAHDLKTKLRGLVKLNEAERGLLGKAEFDAKGFIAKVSDTLNRQFPKYGKANKIASETFRALDAFESQFGRADPKSFRLNETLGARARTLTTNSEAAPKMRDTLDLMNDVVAGRGSAFKGDFNAQVAAADRIERQFYGAPSPGLITPKQIVEATRGSQFVQAKGILEIGTGLAKGAAGISHKNAIESINRLASKDLKRLVRNALDKDSKRNK